MATHIRHYSLMNYRLVLTNVALSLFFFPTNAQAADLQVASTAIEVGPQDWPWWRGPTTNGHAPSGQRPPQRWSDQENVIWKAALPGRGHGSPTVVGDQIFLATADEDRQIQSVVCLDRHTGEQVWSTIVHRGNLVFEGNKKTSPASSTVACDGQHVFVNFLNDHAAYTTALKRADGARQWQQKISDYTVHQGYGSSPTIYGSLVIVSADNKGGGAVMALDRPSGQIIWSHPRPETPNYASPVIVGSAGRDQLVMVGCNLVSSFAPSTGEKLWEISGATTECVTTAVTDGQLIISSGGFPRNHVAAVRADGSGQVVWENNTRVYVPSMIVRDGYLYAVADAGVALCWDIKTGSQMWKSRLGGTFSASPVLVGDLLYATNEGGQTFVWRANPTSFKLVAKNQLGTEVFATSAFCDSRIYMRVMEHNGAARQEILYCLGE